MKKNKDNVPTTLEADPSRTNLQKEQMELIIQDQRITLRQKANSIFDMKIENARRNVQLLGSLCMQYFEKGNPDELREFNKEAMEALLLNVKILKETVSIK